MAHDAPELTAEPLLVPELAVELLAGAGNELLAVPELAVEPLLVPEPAVEPLAVPELLDWVAVEPLSLPEPLASAALLLGWVAAVGAAAGVRVW